MPLKYLSILLVVVPCLLSYYYSPAQLPQQVKTTDGYSLSYRIFGEGEPLLIINGGPGMNSNGFEYLARELSKDFKTIIYDQRGTGKSVLPSIDETTITMRLMIEDIESLRKHLKIERWMILGHSFGGMLASYYATTFPNRISKMVLSSSGGVDLELLNYLSTEISLKLSEPERKAVDYWTSRLNSGDTSYNVRLQRGLNLASAYVYNKEHVPAIGQRLTEGNSRINHIVWSDMRKVNYNCYGKMSSFYQPVLIIHGLNDILRKSTAERIHDTYPNSKLVYLQNCGHYGWLDKPQEYFAAVVNFLKLS